MVGKGSEIVYDNAMCFQLNFLRVMICIVCGLATHVGAFAEGAVRPGTAVPPATATQTAGERLTLRLMGTITTAENGIAICLDPATGNTIRLRVGESFEGWVLSYVHGHQAIFTKASQREVIALSTPDDRQNIPLPPTQATNAAAAPQGVVSVVQSARGLASGTWMDGDGQMIAPPGKSK